jgi:hypothetical protein
VSHIEAAIAQTERWITSIQHEKDRLYLEMNDPRASDVRWGFISARLAFLDVALMEARELLENLEQQRYRPELMFVKRPLPPLTLSMLKARGREKSRKRA